MQTCDIENFMTSTLVVISPQRSLAEASRLMRAHSIRHLPVVQRDKVVGVLSQRDVYLIETLSNTDPEEIRVEEAMTRESLLVDPEEPLHAVSRKMANLEVGSAVVVRDGKLLGLFTVTDALRALAFQPRSCRILTRAPGLRSVCKGAMPRAYSPSRAPAPGSV